MLLLPQHMEKVLLKTNDVEYKEGVLDPGNTGEEIPFNAVITPPKSSEIFRFSGGGNRVDITYKVRTNDPIKAKTGDTIVIRGEDFLIKEAKDYGHIDPVKTFYVGRTD